MLFSFKAVRADGTEYESTMEGVDRFAVYRQIHEKGEAVVYVREKSVRGNLKGFFSFSFGGVKAADRVMFAKNLAAMLRAGLPLDRALAILEKQMKGPEWARVFKSLLNDVSKGTSFSAALGAFPKVFGPLFTSMVAAGQESGNLTEALLTVGEELEKSNELRKRIRGAMFYPLIIVGVMIVIAVLLFVYVMPKLTATFKDFGADLPIMTRALIAVSDFIQTQYPVIIVAVLAIAVFGISAAKSASGKRVIDRTILQTPFIGMVSREVNSARMARTLSSLLTSGVEVSAAIKITAGVVQNTEYQDMLAAAASDVQRGKPIKSFFEARADLYPPFVEEMVGVGEETGTLSKSLLEVATFYEASIAEKTKNLSTVIEPLLMVFIGLGVGVFAIAVIGPIYSLSNSI